MGIGMGTGNGNGQYTASIAGIKESRAFWRRGKNDKLEVGEETTMTILHT